MGAWVLILFLANPRGEEPIFHPVYFATKEACLVAAADIERTVGQIPIPNRSGWKAAAKCFATGA